MLSFLRQMAEAVLDFAAYVEDGCIEALNLVFRGIEAAGNAAMSLLPSFPTSHPKIDPQLLEEINWFFPFAGIASALATALTMYLGWMAVRYALRLVRAV